MEVELPPLHTGRIVRFEEDGRYGFVAPDQGGVDVCLYADALELARVKQPVSTGTRGGVSSARRRARDEGVRRARSGCRAPSRPGVVARAGWDIDQCRNWGANDDRGTVPPQGMETILVADDRITAGRALAASGRDVRVRALPRLGGELARRPDQVKHGLQPAHDRFGA